MGKITTPAEVNTPFVKMKLVPLVLHNKEGGGGRPRVNEKKKKKNSTPMMKKKKKKNAPRVKWEKL